MKKTTRAVLTALVVVLIFGITFICFKNGTATSVRADEYILPTGQYLICGTSYPYSSDFYEYGYWNEQTEEALTDYQFSLISNTSFGGTLNGTYKEHYGYFILRNNNGGYTAYDKYRIKYLSFEIDGNGLHTHLIQFRNKSTQAFTEWYCLDNCEYWFDINYEYGYSNIISFFYTFNVISFSLNYDGELAYNLDSVMEQEYICNYIVDNYTYIDIGLLTESLQDYYYDFGYENGELDGYDSGYEVGELDGFSSAVYTITQSPNSYNLYTKEQYESMTSPATFVATLFNNLGSFFNIVVFPPKITIGLLIGLPLLLGILLIIIKIIRG